VCAIHVSYGTTHTLPSHCPPNENGDATKTSMIVPPSYPLE
jgi:hypothetical protein